MPSRPEGMTLALRLDKLVDGVWWGRGFLPGIVRNSRLLVVPPFERAGIGRHPGLCALGVMRAERWAPPNSFSSRWWREFGDAGRMYGVTRDEARVLTALDDCGWFVRVHYDVEEGFDWFAAFVGPRPATMPEAWAS